MDCSIQHRLKQSGEWLEGWGGVGRQRNSEMWQRVVTQAEEVKTSLKSNGERKQKIEEKTDKEGFRCESIKGQRGLIVGGDSSQRLQGPLTSITVSIYDRAPCLFRQIVLYFLNFFQTPESSFFLLFGGICRYYQAFRRRRTLDST